MTKQAMRDAGFENVDDVRQTKDTTGKDDQDKAIAESPDKSDDDSALFQVYNHFRTNSKGKEQLITTSNE